MRKPKPRIQLPPRESDNEGRCLDPSPAVNEVYQEAALRCREMYGFKPWLNSSSPLMHCRMRLSQIQCRYGSVSARPCWLDFFASRGLRPTRPCRLHPRPWLFGCAITGGGFAGSRFHRVGVPQHGVFGMSWRLSGVVMHGRDWPFGGMSSVWGSWVRRILLVSWVLSAF